MKIGDIGKLLSKLPQVLRELDTVTKAIGAIAFIALFIAIYGCASLPEKDRITAINLGFGVLFSALIAYIILEILAQRRPASPTPPSPAQLQLTPRSVIVSVTIDLKQSRRLFATISQTVEECGGQLIENLAPSANDTSHRFAWVREAMEANVAYVAIIGRTFDSDTSFGRSWLEVECDCAFFRNAQCRLLIAGAAMGGREESTFAMRRDILVNRLRRAALPEASSMFLPAKHLELARKLRSILIELRHPSSGERV